MAHPERCVICSTSADVVEVTIEARSMPLQDPDGNKFDAEHHFCGRHLREWLTAIGTAMGVLVVNWEKRG